MPLRNLFGKNRWKKDFAAGEEALRSGKLDTAEEKLTAALEQAEKLGERDEAVADTAYQLARVYQAQKKGRLAEAMDRRAFSIRVDLLGPGHALTVESYLAIMERSGNPPELDDEELLRGALAQCGARFGDLSWQHARLLAGLVNALPPGSEEIESIAGTARRVCEWLLGEGRSTLGKSPDVAGSLGQAFHWKERTAEAVTFHGMSVVYHEQLSGPDSAPVAEALVELGKVCLVAGQPEEAETHLRRALTLLELRAADPSPAVSLLARALRDQHRFLEAAPLLRRRLEFLSDPEEQADALLGLLEADCSRGQPDPNRLFDLTGDLPTHSLLEVARGLRRCAGILARRWCEALGEELLKKSLELAEQSVGPTHAEVGRTLATSALHLLRLGNRRRALELLDRASGCEQTPELLLDRAEALAVAGDVDQALDLGQRALSKAGQDEFELHRRLAHLLLEAGRFDQACARARAALGGSERERALGELILGRALGLGGDLRGAADTLRQAADRLPSRQTADWAEAQAELGAALGLIGRDEEGAGRFRSGLEFEQHAPDHPVVALLYAGAARLAADRDRRLEARRLADQAVSSLATATRRDDARRSLVLLRVAPVAAYLEAWDQAMGLASEALDLLDYRSVRIPVFPFGEAAAPLLEAQALVLSHQGRHDDALRRAEEARGRQHDLLGPDDPRTLATALCEPEPSIETLQAAADRLESRFGRTSSWRRRCLEGLAFRLIAADRRDEAAQTLAAARAIGSSRAQEQVALLLEPASVDVDPIEAALGFDEEIPAAEPEVETEPEPEAEVEVEPEPEVEPGEEAPVEEESSPVLEAALGDPRELDSYQALRRGSLPPSVEDEEAVLAESRARFGEGNVGLLLEELALLHPPGSVRAGQLLEQALDLKGDQVRALIERLAGEGRPDLEEVAWRHVAESGRARFGLEHPSTLEALLGQARAARRQGRVAVAEELLRQLLEQEVHLEDQPGLLLEALNQLALILRLDRPLEAEPLLTRLLEEGRRRQGSTGPAMSEALHGLLELNFELDRRDEARTHQQRLLRLLPTLPEAVRLDTARRFVALGRRLQEQFLATQEAELLLRKGHAVRAELAGENSLATAEALAELARNDQLRGFDRRARERLSKALSVAADQAEPGLAERLRIAQIATHLRCHQQARDVLEELLEHEVARAGRTSPRAARVMLGLVDLELSAFDLERAESAARLASSSLGTPEPLRQLARVHALKGDYRAAEEALKQAVVSTSGHRKAALLLDLGSLAAERGFLGQATTSLSEARALLESWPGHPDRVRAMLLSGRIEGLQERWVPALESLEEGRRLTDARTARDDPRRAEPLLWQGWALRGSGRYDEAIALLAEARDLVTDRDSLFPQGLARLAALLELGRTQLLAGQTENAEKTLRAAHETAPVLTEDHPQRVDLATLEAELREAQGAIEQALEAWERAAQRLPDGPLTARALERAARLHLASGRWEAAAEFADSAERLYDEMGAEEGLERIHELLLDIDATASREEVIPRPAPVPAQPVAEELADGDSEAGEEETAEVEVEVEAAEEEHAEVELEAAEEEHAAVELEAPDEEPPAPSSWSTQRGPAVSGTVKTLLNRLRGEGPSEPEEPIAEPPSLSPSTLSEHESIRLSRDPLSVPLEPTPIKGIRGGSRPSARRRTRGFAESSVELVPEALAPSGHWAETGYLENPFPLPEVLRDQGLTPRAALLATPPLLPEILPLEQVPGGNVEDPLELRLLPVHEVDPRELLCWAQRAYARTDWLEAERLARRASFALENDALSQEARAFYGWLRALRGDYRQAEELFRAVLEEMGEGPLEGCRLVCERGLTSSLAGQGRALEASALLERRIGKDHPLDALLRASLAELLHLQGHGAQAAGQARLALKGVARLAERERVASLVALARLTLRRDRTELGSRLSLEALELSREWAGQEGVTSYYRQAALGVCAEASLLAGRASEAQDYARQALALAERCQPLQWGAIAEGRLGLILAMEQGGREAMILLQSARAELMAYQAPWCEDSIRHLEAALAFVECRAPVG